VKPVSAPVPVRNALTARLLRPRPPQVLYPPLTVLWCIVIGCMVLTAQDHLLGGDHQLDHYHLTGLGASELLLLIPGWLVMLTAMMGPALMPAARHVALNTLSPHRTVTCFVVAYLLLWTGFGGAASIGFQLQDRVLGSGIWTTDHRSMILVIVVAAAGAWQLTPAKRACLRACRAGGVLPAAGGRADRGALKFGARHATTCIGSCGPMMLIMLAAQGWQLLWMILLGGVIWLEKARGLRRQLERPTATVFAVLAATIALMSFIGALA
jgi:predicted metal-binding membrane protein